MNILYINTITVNLLKSRKIVNLFIFSSLGLKVILDSNSIFLKEFFYRLIFAFKPEIGKFNLVKSLSYSSKI